MSSRSLAGEADRALDPARRRSWRSHSTVPHVRPVGEILLRVSGWPKVERVLQATDTVEQAGVDPATARPGDWRHVHNRLAAGKEPRPYLPRAMRPGSNDGGPDHHALRICRDNLLSRR
jgi:hypothetical protein